MIGLRHLVALGSLTALLASCGGGSSGPSAFPVGGMVSGLATGATVTLSDNGADSLTINANGAFTFGVPLRSGNTYSVAVTTQPSTQVCTVASGSGTVASQQVTSIKVSCVGPFLVGGSVSGLNSGLQAGLTNNGADASVVTADGAFTFPTALKPGSSYAVAIATQPNGEQCFVANASGTVSTSNVTTVDITCGVPTLSLVAGGLGGPGNLDGTGSSARFYYPEDVAVDSAGNLYIADQYNRTVRKISASGMVTTLAGTPGQYGTADGTGAAAQFANPTSLSVDPTGILYVTDAGVNTIRRISPTGVVTTLAGTPNTGGTMDGVGAAARFSNPNGIRVTPSGAIYLADNNRIRSITPTGVVSTIYTGMTQLLYVAIDSGGGLFATDLGYKTAVKIDLVAGTETTLASGFQNPVGICVAPTGTPAAGTLYVTDEFAATVSAISPSGALSTFAGTAGQYGSTDATGATARFYSPTGMTVDGTGALFVADPGNNALRKISSSGVVTTFAGAPALTGNVDDTGAAARFSGPAGLAADANGTLYVGDVGNGAIRKVTPAGVVTHALAAGLSISLPQTLTLDTAGTFYVSVRNAILMVSPAGVITTLAGDPNGQSGYTDGTGSVARFNAPAGIALDAGGNLYVADMGNFAIRKVTPGGAVTTFAGQAGVAGQSDGTGSAARFTLPGVLAIDGAGILYLTDGNAIRTISPTAVVTTLAGSQTVGSADGIGAIAGFNQPYGLAVGPAGSLYVSDTFNHAIRKVTAGGVVTTLAGASARIGVAPGVLPASLNLPLGIAFIGTKLYIVDSAENSLLAIDYVP